MGRPKGSKNKPKTDTAARSTRTRKSEVQSSVGMGDEVAVIITFAVSVFLFLSNIGLCGPFGEMLRAFQLGLFGTVGYIFPLVLLLVVIFMISNIDNPKAAFRMTAVLFMLIFLSALFELWLGKGMDNRSILDFYKESAVNGLGGGVIGGALAMLLYSFAGSIGAIFILIAVIFVCLVYITEKPLMRMIARGSMSAASRAGSRAKEDFDVMKERSRVHREERMRQREEARANAEKLGVDFDSIDLQRSHNAATQVTNQDVFADGQKVEGHQLDFLSDDYLDQKLGNLSTPTTDIDEMPQDADQQYDQYSEEREQYVDKSYDGSFHGDIDGDAYTTGMNGSGYQGNPGEIELPLNVKHERYNIETATDDVSSVAAAATLGVAGTFASGAASTSSLGSAGSYVSNVESASTLATASEAATLASTASGSSIINVSAVKPLQVEELDTTTSSENGAAASRVSADGRVTIPVDRDANGTRRIVTSSGQVIESDVEAIQKRVEKKRAEATSDVDNLKMQQEIQKKKVVKKPYRFPPLNILKKGGVQSRDSKDEIRQNAITLKQTLESFGVGVTVTDVSVGPAVTRYELKPEQGVKINKIVSLTNDIKMGLAAADIRIEAPIPGKSAVGIEVPNKTAQTVYLGDIITSPEFRNSKAKLAFGVGKDIAGKTVVTDIAKMPHLLIAGATGSGKSVSINTLIMSIVYKYKPEEVRMIMIDPKVVELQVYNGIPHLLIPVVTDPKKAAASLNWAVAEMEQRYKKFAESGVRDLSGYNEKVDLVRQDPNIPEEEKPERMPQIVIIIDELADLMMVSAQEVEDSICRIAQLARAAGMHLVIATQRPSVNVITGLIKANVPSRIAFAVSSGVDSRTIIDGVGAEKLLGKGDMLFFPQGMPKPIRCQGAFVSDEEVMKVVDFIKKNSEAEYQEDIQSSIQSSPGDSGSEGSDDRDVLFREAGELIIDSDKASIGMLQRRFRIGFNRAARIMDQLADASVVGPEEGTKPRKIIMTMDEFHEAF